VKNIRNKIRNIAEKAGFLSDATLKRDNLILVASISVLVFLYPFIMDSDFDKLIFDILVSSIIFFGITSLKFRKEKFVRLLYFGSFTLVLVWINYFIFSTETRIAMFIVLTLFLIYITYSMISHVSRNKEVNAILILNAINSYLLLGIIAAFLFILADISYYFLFDISGSTIKFTYTNDPSTYDYIYYSYITLTTVGYGDATPAIPLTRSLAMLVSLSGQLYLTILVAMLVGKFLAKRD